MADRLDRYRSKRDFSRTREPQGEPGAARADGLWFSVQKHDASSLHYDLRLEWDGVLLSWAVPKGPAAVTGTKRLAQRTEDHPLDYGDFEGTIPAKEYGGGTVMLWDQGTWRPRGDVDEMLEAGNLKMDIAGQRMRGGWALVRFAKGGEGAWLLIKEKDGYAGSRAEALTQDFDTSVKTGRDMAAIATGEPAEEGDAPEAAEEMGAPERAAPAPSWRKPQLATLVDEAPEGDEWVHETKFDGYRALAALGRDGPRLWTRNGKDWTQRFGALAHAFDRLPCDAALIDGEVMAARIEGSPFSSLQRALGESGDLVYFAFDLLEIDGEDLAGAPQSARRERLERLFRGVPATGPLRLAQQVPGGGAEIFAAACRSGAEGIVSKKADAPYRGDRTRAWRKVKCTGRQEFVVGGYTPSDKDRPFASLLVGAHDGDRLIYRGRVGTGYSEDDLARLAEGFRQRKTSPFEAVPRAVARDAAWVTPDTVIEVEFTELTADGQIRHGAYQGTRGDKSPAEVAVETPEAAAEAPREAKVSGIEISSPGREVFPGSGCTKLDIARHYDRVGARLVEIAGHRPLSLVRAPKGIDGHTFFQKHAGKGFPDALQEIEITESDGTEARYMYATRPESFVAAAQMGTVEFHIWGSRTDRLDRPDRLVFDLDPDTSLGWGDVRAAAFDLRDRLADLGLAAGVVVTGGKGVHVWVPLRRAHGWDLVKGFAKTVAHLLAEAEPKQFVATMSKSKRDGRIFVDWLRNERGATAIAPYSLRARPGAPVAVPVTWDELADIEAAPAFGMGAVKERLEEPCPYLEHEADLQSITKEVIDRLELGAG